MEKTLGPKKVMLIKKNECKHLCEVLVKNWIKVGISLAFLHLFVENMGKRPFCRF